MHSGLTIVQVTYNTISQSQQDSQQQEVNLNNNTTKIEIIGHPPKATQDPQAAPTPPLAHPVT